MKIKIFFNIPCKSAPDIPKDDPTNKAAINLGNRRSHIIVWFSSSPFLNIASQISLFDIKTEPLANENKETIIKRKKTNDKENKNLLFRKLIFFLMT